MEMCSEICEKLNFPGVIQERQGQNYSYQLSRIQSLDWGHYWRFEQWNNKFIACFYSRMRSNWR